MSYKGYTRCMQNCRIQHAVRRSGRVWGSGEGRLLRTTSLPQYTSTRRSGAGPTQTRPERDTLRTHVNVSILSPQVYVSFAPSPPHLLLLPAFGITLSPACLFTRFTLPAPPTERWDAPPGDLPPIAAPPPALTVAP